MSTIRSRRTVLAVLTSVVLVAALVVVVAGQWWLHGQRTDDDREADVREAAERAVAAVLSYDYRRLAEGREDTVPLLTGDAEEQYLQVQRPLRRSAPTLEAVVSAEVKAAAVLEVDGDTARVLLFVDQLSSSKKLRQPQLDQSRVVVTLEHEGDDWLVSTLAAI